MGKLEKIDLFVRNDVADLVPASVGLEWLSGQKVKVRKGGVAVQLRGEGAKYTFLDNWVNLYRQEKQWKLATSLPSAYTSPLVEGPTSAPIGVQVEVNGSFGDAAKSGAVREVLLSGLQIRSLWKRGAILRGSA